MSQLPLSEALYRQKVRTALRQRVEGIREPEPIGTGETIPIISSYEYTTTDLENFPVIYIGMENEALVQASSISYPLYKRTMAMSVIYHSSSSTTEYIDQLYDLSELIGRTIEWRIGRRPYLGIRGAVAELQSTKYGMVTEDRKISASFTLAMNMEYVFPYNKFDDS